ncbi:site-2 protease family protein [Paenibacillus sp. N4]|uniref:site-2 protease family protein n=1 Tax=Paenibacillus vietnamensis TaxID=2590547 RepID=UPI001CD1701C|nr:site-2 protease family protein [Paenibacillus vietnamensis]MCA0754606.1 site-2 protease family protein [Paenibacillus vietnamensis]
MDLQRFLWYPIEDLPFIALALIIAFTVHEFAHAYSAYKFGDDTAYKAGRVTLNPRVHLDVLGTILLLIAGFGWAKPVPVMPGRFKHPRLMGIVVSAVGPISNLLMAVIGMLVLYILNQTGVLHAGSQGVYLALVHFFYYLITLNLLLFIFNLIPLPPLDGYRILSDLMPLKIRYKMDQNVQWGMFIFLLMVFIPPLREVTLTPVLGLQWDIFFILRDFFDYVFSPLDWQSLIIDFAM